MDKQQILEIMRQIRYQITRTALYEPEYLTDGKKFTREEEIALDALSDAWTVLYDAGKKIEGGE